jgi:hypothetical protein
LKFFTLYNKKKRAISPVIAVILLIGLAVAAAAAIFLVVMPLFEPTTNLELTDAYIVYDDSYTKIADAGIGYGQGSVFLSNAGTGKIEISEIAISYLSLSANNWTTITNALSLQDITTNDPYEVSPLSINEELSIRFPIPSENINSTISYKITVTTKDGTTLDTSRVTTVDEEEMLLTKDRPDISAPSSIGMIRRTHTISPLSVSDNSDIKNVIYEVSNDSGIVKTVTIASSLWRWQWNTYNDPEVSNGTYDLRMTVNDYAGLSDFVNVLNFEIDNDYVNPIISNIEGSSLKNGPNIAEVGESFAITAEITDSGSTVSNVNEAFIHYKLNDSSTNYQVASMTQGSGDSWSGNIPAAFISSDALAKNLTYYLSAIDDDTNVDLTTSYYSDVNDSTEPNFVSHTYEGQSIITQDPLIGDEGQTLSLSVSVEDKDEVSTVNMVWRERNDTGIAPQYGNWKMFVNFTGSGENWDFRLPALNVTLDGLEYYFNATDPANNTAYDGTPSSPYRIVVADEVNPVISVLSTIPVSITEGTDLDVTVAIADNDKTFSWTGQETGIVKLGYKKPGDSVFTYLDMSHTSGDSSIGETSIWTGTIGGSNFSISATPVLVEVFATDDAGKSSLIQNSIDVTSSGTPLLVYLTGTGEVTGASDHQLVFDVKNDAGGALPATANITDIQIELLDNGKTILAGTPVTTLIDVSGTVWQNNSALEGANNSLITLDSPFLVTKGSTITFTLTYANSSGGFYNLNDLTVKPTLFYEFGVSSNDSEQLDSFDTPSTQSIPTTETRFLRSNAATVNGLTAYDLGTSLTGSIGLFDQSSTVSGDQSVTWGIRVYIRHSTGTEAEITSGMVATVARPSGGDAAGMQTNTWLCPLTPLASTDSIVIEVWYQIGASSPTIASEFTTPQLGATQLDASTWSVSYYTERDRSGGFFNRQTTALFHWGDTAHNSRIENFAYSTSGGGGGASIESSGPISTLNLTLPIDAKIVNSMDSIIDTEVSLFKRRDFIRVF